MNLIKLISRKIKIIKLAAEILILRFRLLRHIKKIKKSTLYVDIAIQKLNKLVANYNKLFDKKMTPFTKGNNEK